MSRTDREIEILEVLQSISEHFAGIGVTLDRISSKLDRIASALESKSIQAKRPESQPALTPDSLPILDGFRVVVFHGTSFVTTKFIARASAQKRQSAAICVDFRDRNELPEKHPDYRERSVSSGYQTHIVLGWDAYVIPGPLDIPEALDPLFSFADAAVHVSDEGKWLLVSFPEMTIVQQGQIATGPR